MPARSRDRPPGPSADSRRLWVRPASGLFWSMNWESWLVPKNSLMDATTGRMLISVCGVIASTSWVVIRSRTTRSIRDRPVRTWFWMSSPTLRSRRLPKWSMSSVSTRSCTSSPLRTPVIVSSPACRADEVADRRDDVVDGQRRLAELAHDTELLVQLVATDLGQVVALAVEVEVVEEGLGGLLGRRLARTQLAVDVEQGVVLARRVVLLEGEPDRLVLAEGLEDLLVGPTQGLEQDGHRLLALAVDAYPDHVALVDLELEPGAAARDDLGGEDVLVGRLVRACARRRRPGCGRAARRRPARCR